MHDFKKDRYPRNWKKIARLVKERAGWRCEECGHPHDPEHGYTLTCSHIIPIRELCEPWNLQALCQRCHLKHEAKTLQHRYIYRAIYAFHDREEALEILRGYAHDFRKSRTLRLPWQ